MPAEEAGTRQAIADVLAKFTGGFERSDAAEVMASLRRGPDTTMFGTDEDEDWRDRADIADAFEAMVPEIVNAAYSWGEAEPLIVVRGATAWATGILSLTTDEDSGRETMPMRATFVLTQESGLWAIEHAHFSCGAQIAS